MADRAGSAGSSGSSSGPASSSAPPPWVAPTLGWRSWAQQAPAPGQLEVTPESPSATGRGARVSRFRAQRPWISLDPRLRRRSTTLVIVLSRPGPIRFTLRQLSPLCRQVGTFTAPGQAGVNRIQFRARSRRILTPGTYSLAVRPLGTSVRARVVRLVVVDGRAPGAALPTLLRANACGVTETPFPTRGDLEPRLGVDRLDSALADSRAEAPANGDGAPQDAAVDPTTSYLGGPARGVLPSGRVLGQAFALSEEHPWAPLMLAMLAGIGMMLIGLSAMPPGAMPTQMVALAVARRRYELAVAGSTALFAACAAYVLILVLL